MRIVPATGSAAGGVKSTGAVVHVTVAHPRGAESEASLTHLSKQNVITARQHFQQRVQGEVTKGKGEGRGKGGRSYRYTHPKP